MTTERTAPLRPGPGPRIPHQRRRRPGRLRRVLRRAPGGDAGHRRRDRIGQVDAGAFGAAGAAAHLGLGDLPRHRPDHAARHPAPAGPAAPADGVPGPVRVAGPEMGRPGPGRRTADRLPGRRPGRPAPAGRRGARARRARPGQPRPPPAPGAVRRPGPAGGDRPGGGAVPGPDHLRRAGLLPGRADPGPGAQPVRAAAHRARPVLPVHRPRPGPGQAGERPGGGHVPGQAVRGRAGGGGLPGAAAPLHAGAARLGAQHRARGCPHRGHDQRRAAVTDPPAQRLPVPHPVPARRRTLRGAGAAHARAAATGHTVACHFPLVEAARTTARSEEIEETP